ncbi:right-handed parallel beta-helix repeat-containing protein [Frateuria sp. YIM B11624]|uniref:right-handed parallel beta-helix repeat-containing protein n=1 Tax=Frateuria sp. YIM B11624 TaxID=3143185 RepID=UPI003C756F29
MSAAARREFLRRSLALGAAVLFAPLSRGSSAATGKVVDVRSKGARGDGHSDDTAAIQAAIDALPAGGGTVRVPAGNYMVDASRAISLRSNVRLELAPDAQLTALPNALRRYHVIRVWRVQNVQIVGGRIVGERDQHQGDTGEWGYGINIQAARNVTVDGTHISDCWGDGMWIGAFGRGANADLSEDVTVRNVVCTNNRRQGLSVGPCKRVRILDSTFSDTHGTAPQSGIDLEPMRQGEASDLLIQGCTMTGNKGCGLEIHHSVSGVVVRQCTIRDNAGYGVLAAQMTDLWVDGNTITGNGLNGVKLAGHTRDVKVTGNTLSSNSTRSLRRSLKALASGAPGGPHAAQLQIGKNTSNVHVSGNVF